MSTELEQNLRALEPHEEYNIPTADLFIMVENTQFRVHRYFFERESTWFAGRLNTPASPGAKPQGSDASTAIILDRLTPQQFARFLWVFYNKHYSLYEAEVEDWEVILSLSNRWLFAEVKNLAIRELQKKTMDHVRRIKLYNDNHVDPNYLVPCYAALCEREDPLTEEEGEYLGMRTAIQIAAARERSRASRLPTGVMSPLTPTVHGADLQEVIRELFKITLSGNGFTREETTNTAGALTTPPTSSQLNQSTHKEQTASSQQLTQKQKQGTKKEPRTGTSQPLTPATPQKLVATPTATPTLPKPQPWPAPTKETAAAAAAATTKEGKTQRAADVDVPGQEKKEGGAGTSSSGDVAPPAEGSAKAEPLVDVSTTDNNTSVPDPNNPSTKSTIPDDSFAESGLSPISFSFDPSSPVQTSVFGVIERWDNLS